MNPAVSATVPGPQAPGAAPAGEGKPGRPSTDGGAGEEFSVVLAAVFGAAAPRLQAEETPPEQQVAGSEQDPAENNGAEVVTPAASGAVPGPSGRDASHGAGVTLPPTAAHLAPVRANSPVPSPSSTAQAAPADGQAARSAAATPPPGGVPAAPAAPATSDAPDAPVPGAGVGGPAAGAEPPEVAPRAGTADGIADDPAGDLSVPPPSEKAPLDKAGAAHAGAAKAPAAWASPRAQAIAAGEQAPGLRPAETPRSPRADAAPRPGGHGPGAESGPGPITAPPPPAAGPVGAAAPVSSPAASAAPSPVVSQVVEVIKPLARTEGGADEVVLELRPADLGTVRVEVRVEGGVVHAILRAEQDSTAELLRQALPELREALADAGLRPGDLGCDNGRTGRGPGSQERPAWARDPDGEPGTPAEPALAHRPADPRSSLDLLL